MRSVEPATSDGLRNADSAIGRHMVDGAPMLATAISAHGMDLQALFSALTVATPQPAACLRGHGFSRYRLRQQAHLMLDRFDGADATCAAVRFPAGDGNRLKLGINGGYQVATPAAGGWLLTPKAEGMDAYWAPQKPMLRRLDGDGHILSHRPAGIAGFDVSLDGLTLHVDQPAGEVLDLVIWRLPAHETDLLRSLQSLSALEQQRYFMWSSHTPYARPADLYLHWVHGHVYENHEVWPKYWRVCSELDAYALYVTLTGLLRATGKKIYDLMRLQVVFSVIDRQADDGGWYHGEWTDEMESHFRLHAGGMHLLAAHLEESGDPIVGAALEKAAAFAATKTDQLACGAWHLHDSMEQGADAMRKYPFRHLPSRALGKAESNLLVLNTHLDTNIAMARHRRVSRTGQYDSLIASAHAASSAVLQLRPADWLYRPLFRAIGLTFLPKDRASALSLPRRALKRLAWKYFIPWLPHIKRRWPRLVMPGGYIERELTMRAFSVRYQPVNLMDLARTRRLFDDVTLDPLLSESFAYTQGCGLTERWKEQKGKEDDSLGFWAEALYHLALTGPDQRHRGWLAQAMLDLEDNGLGLPPSLLGSNAEAVPPAQQSPCPSPADRRLRVANLSRGETTEWLVVNPSAEAVALVWDRVPAVEVAWQTHLTAPVGGAAQAPVVMPRSWLLGTGGRAA